ncbi:hypothetical protein ACQKP5_27565 [Pseudomonas vancouverensis]|uniref:hypothetical protein n=1 Tax=Pseudomonas vancouverensis TaxID=95300 RepID=UPI003D024D9E
MPTALLKTNQLLSLKVCFWQILLKKSAIACAAEKYASEIEIFTFGKDFWTRISRARVQKWHFHPSMIRQFGQTDFFNRIGRIPPVAKGGNSKQSVNV